MSLIHSLSIVTSGLVLGYDMNNTGRSWKGAPTTNMYADGDFASGTSHPVNGGTGKTFIADPRDPNKKVLRFPAQSNTQYHGRDIVAVVSSVYSFQMEFYVSTDYDGTQVGMFPEQGGSGGAVYYNMGAKGTWQSLKFNGQVASTTNIRMLAYLLTTSTTGYVLCANVQCELSPVVTQFTSSSRSSTQSLLDLTGNNTITASSLTYASDNTFSFNGSTNYLPATITDTALNGDPIFSVEMVIKRTATLSSGGYWGIGTGVSLQGISGHTSVSDMIGIDLWGTATFHTGVTYPLNQWIHVVWVKYASTFNINSVIVYINGVSYTGAQFSVVRGTTHTPALATTTAGNGACFGRLATSTSSYYAPGQIGIARLYNRALTAVEVQQNFQAVRGRYGL